MIENAEARATQTKTGLLRAPDVTVARLILVSYLRSGWMLVEFVLVLACFAALYFPFLENTVYFNGTSTFALGAIAILGPVIMVRQATSARTYLLLARLTARAAYSRGLMLAAAALRIPLYLFFLALVLLFHRLIDPTANLLFWGAVGVIPNTILVATLTVALCSPMATRLKRIYFLAWLALVLFSFKPIFTIPRWLENVLSISQIPLWPVGACYTLGATGTFSLLSLLGLLLLACYCVLIALVAGYWLEKRELLLY
jgi:hypothetical protein